MSLAPAICLDEQQSLAAVVACPDNDYRQGIMQTLHSARWMAQEALGGAEALAKLDATPCHALLVDRTLPDLEVGELLEIVKSRHPEIDIFLLDSETGQVPLLQGTPRHLRARELFRVSGNAPGWPPRKQPGKIDSNAAFNQEPPVAVEPLPGMIGTSLQMAAMYRMVRLVAARATTVLLTGETGTGKELVAQALHQLSARAKNPFVVINCAAIPETLLEAELFGYERGAFTGAVQSRMGRIQAARGGTLFLDEISEIPLSMQAKLLRFLQEGELQRLGSPGMSRVDARVIAATNTDLAERVAARQFRQDLYYRLSIFPIELPPLRSRQADIVPLAEHFLASLCRQASGEPKSLPPVAHRALEAHRWPGNVRELQHVIERAFILSEEKTELLPFTGWKHLTSPTLSARFPTSAS